MVKHTAIISIGEETILCEKGGIETSFLKMLFNAIFFAVGENLLFNKRL